MPLKGFLVHSGPLHFGPGCFWTANYQALLELLSLLPFSSINWKHCCWNTFCLCLHSLDLTVSPQRGFSSVVDCIRIWYSLAKVELPNIGQAWCQGTAASLTSEKYVDSICYKEFYQDISVVEPF